MRVLPILFNTDMVRALLEERKTVTRRVIKPQHLLALDSPYHREHPEIPDNVILEKLYSPYIPGDILYVRETWSMISEWTNVDPNVGMFDGYIYKADWTDDEHPRWRPSIHTPKAAARIFLRVKSVRAEKLRDSFFAPISPIFELRAEGMDIGDDCRQCIATYGNPCCVDTVDEDGSNLYGGDCGILDEIRGEFSTLWDSTVKPNDLDKFGWTADPWVWVIEFERVDKPEGWL